MLYKNVCSLILSLSSTLSGIYILSLSSTLSGIYILLCNFVFSQVKPRIVCSKGKLYKKNYNKKHTFSRVDLQTKYQDLRLRSYIIVHLQYVLNNMTLGGWRFIANL